MLFKAAMQSDKFGFFKSRRGERPSQQYGPTVAYRHVRAYGSISLPTLCIYNTDLHCQEGTIHCGFKLITHNVYTSIVLISYLNVRLLGDELLVLFLYLLDHLREQ